MILMTTFSLIIPMILILINTIISMKKKMEREKGSPFECGFDPKSSARIPFSLHFFLIAVIFLIFDVEITILMPMPIILSMMSIKMWMFLSMLFILILVLGTIHEWNEGSLEWSK